MNTENLIRFLYYSGYSISEFHYHLTRGHIVNDSYFIHNSTVSLKRLLK